MEENKQVVAEWKATNQERLSEIKSFNPELYSAINLALNYLNKSLTGEELPQEVEEVKVQPTSNEGFWRIMTEKELLDKYGSRKKASFDTGWDAKGRMDWMFGMPIKDLIKDNLTEEEIGKTINNDPLETDPLKDPNRYSWFIFPDSVIFDTSNVKQPEPTSVKEWRFKTIQEINDQKLGYYGVDQKTMLKYVGKTLTQLDSQGFLRDGIANIIERIEDTGLIYIDGFAFSYSYFTQDPLPQQKGTTSFPDFAIFDTSNVAQQSTQRNLSGWRLVTEEELKKKKFGDLGIPEHVWKQIYGKPIEDFYDFDSEIAESIQRLNSNENPKKFTKGIAGGYNVTDNYFVYEYPAEQTTSTNEWRFKTLDEIQKEGLGFAGTSEKLINRYASKKLKDIVDSVDFDRYLKNIKNQEGSIITSDGYSYPYKFFTDQPLPQETTTGFKLSIETLPATLKRDYIFTPNTGNRKAPSQSAGYLYSKYANLPAAQAELFSTFFKGNDGAWWKLKQVGTEWRWEKSSPQPSQTTTSTSSKNIDQMIREAAEKFAQNKTIANLPPYLKQLAINNQIKQSRVVRENISLSTGFSWVDSNEGKVFWSDVVGGGFLTQKVLSVIGSKEKLFEMPLKQSVEQPKTETKQEWMPQDLVGKTLLFGSSGKKYLVEKFTRNNPKNKQYNLRDLTSPNTPLVTYNIGMSIIKKWLDGQSAGGVRIIEETPTGSDYSTWTQAQLNQKRKEISDAMIVFEKDDPEYKELKDQLDVIDAFID